jgi:hypothetical protein
MPIETAIRFVDEVGFAYGVKQISNKPRVSAMPYQYDIAEGNVPGHSGWSKMGFNSDIQTAEEVVAPQGGAYVFPDAPQHMHVVSSSVEDDPAVAGTGAAGTGAYTVTLYYLDSMWLEKSETITLNGQTAVETVSQDIYRVQNMRVNTTGTGLKPAGGISVKNHGETITYGFIAAGNTRQRQFVWTVPFGKTLYITQANVYCVHTAANKVGTITLRASFDDKTGLRLASGMMMAYAEAILADAPISVTYTMPKKFSEKVDIMVVGKSTGTASIALTMAGWTETT